MRFALLGVLSMAAALAQVSASGKVEGRVVDSAGEPLRGVHVEIRTPSPPFPRVQETTTTFDGRFVMEAVAPGTYDFAVRSEGHYVDRAMPRVTVASAETTKAEIVMSPLGRISGRVTGPEGEPVARAKIQAMRRMTIDGAVRGFSGEGLGETDERGEFHLGNVRPGRFYLALLPYGYLSEDAGNLHPTFYPDAPDLGTARAVVVRGGVETAGIDIRLRDEPRYAVRGKVIAPEGYAIEDLGLQLEPRDIPPGGFFGGAVAKADGAFEFTGYLPGQYTLRTETGGVREAGLHGQTQVVIGRGDVEDIELRVMPNVRVEGVVLLEDGQPMEDAPAQVWVGTRGQSKIDDLGAFVLDQLPALKYALRVTGLPDGHYVKSARFGGQDVLAQPLDLTSGMSGRLDIVISDKGVSIGGTVDVKDQPDLFALVLCWRDGEAVPRIARTAGAHMFRFSNLPPAKYRLLALTSPGDDGILDDPQFRAAFAADTKTVDAKEGARETVDLKLIPREVIEREAAKFP